MVPCSAGERARGKPLSIETGAVGRPPGRRGAESRSRPNRGVCHTDAFTLSGDDPEGLFPAIPRARGPRGVVVDVGDGVTSVAPGDHVIPLYVPECRQCDYCTSGRIQPLPVDPRDPGRGRHAGRLQPLLPRRRQDLPLHGHVHLRELHRRLRVFGREGPGGRTLRQDLLHRLAASPPASGAVINTAKVRPGDNVVVFGLGGIGLNVVQGRPPWSAPT